MIQISEIKIMTDIAALYWTGVMHYELKTWANLLKKSEVELLSPV